jgi:hypothetical protein
VFIIGIIALMVVAAINTIGGLQPNDAPRNGQTVMIVTPTPDTVRNNLQLQTFGYVTIAPTPKYSNLCAEGGVNNEPEILVGYAPAAGQTVSATGQIKVWVTDEGVPLIAPNEQVNLSTGKVMVHGDTAAKAPDNFLWEPALYLDSLAESGGVAHFPDYIKGDFNNNIHSGAETSGTVGAPIDTPPSGGGKGGYTAEYIWDVASLGLTSGTHAAQFIIHDGDNDRGVGCVNIQIQ